MNQILLGASIPFLAGALIYLCRGMRAGLPLLITTPLAMAALALWAIAPDLPRIVGLHSLYDRLSRDPRMDIFLWHYTIDQIESDSRWYAVGIVLMAGALLAAAYRELKRREDA